MVKSFEEKVRLIEELDRALYNVLKLELSKEKPRAGMTDCALKYIRLNKDQLSKRMENPLDGLELPDLTQYDFE